ncbi:MAG: hypothetical protein D3M94_03415 [Rhodocyclales bacterium GT-UBC]|nr:MAG: hypothetical protein D3M94_03415 [Rhodocyclales bacterium GT-UBC]
MPAMPCSIKSPERRLLAGSFAVSLLVHALLLLVPQRTPEGRGAPLARLEATLAAAAVTAVAPATPPMMPAAPARKKSGRTVRRSTPVLLAPSSQPTWSVAEKAEMDGFLDELAVQARRTTKPSLAERSIALARTAARQMAAQEADKLAVLEMRPNSPPVDPFSLEMYLDALVRRLNRSAGFTQNDPRARGVQAAAVQFRLNPDGSLKSFEVLNAADQAVEIAFIRSVVERAVPFSPFPPDIDRAARSLGVTICIRPGRGEGGLGFSRTDGRAC